MSRLINWSKELEQQKNKHIVLIQATTVDVSAKWREAVDVATNRKGALPEALAFHVALFEVFT